MYRKETLTSDPNYMQPCPSWAYRFKITAYGTWTPKPKEYDFDKLEKARIDQYGYISLEAEE